MTTRTLDVGLQRERTAMAWTRTVLGLVVNGVLVLVRHERAFPLAVAIPLAVLCAALVVLVVAVSLRRSGIQRQADRDIRPATWEAAALAVGLTAVAGLEVAAVVLGP